MLVLQDVKTLQPMPAGLVEGSLEMLFNRFDIGQDKPSDGGLYLRRWRMLGHEATLPSLRGYDVMLHRMVRPDQDKDPHDHPWDEWWSLVVKGSYIEEVWEEPNIHRSRRPTDRPHTVVRYAGEISRRSGKHMHKITSLPHGECWTLVWAKGRTRDWGFWTEHGWVDYRTYTGRTS